MNDDILKRIESLESRLAFQDDTIDALNNSITELSMENTLLKRQIQLLAEKLKTRNASAVASEADEVPPPHY